MPNQPFSPVEPYVVADYLTDVQEAAIRFHLGYGNWGSDDDGQQPFYRFADLEILEYKLTHLRPEENTNVVSQLTLIQSLYTTWQTAVANPVITGAGPATFRPDYPEMVFRSYVTSCKLLASMLGPVTYRGIGANANRWVI